MVEYIERTELRDALYDADAITMQGVKILNQFPAADVAPVVHGRWEYYSTTMQECSECHRHTARHRFEYCPRCGARMDGSGDG